MKTAEPLRQQKVASKFSISAALHKTETEEDKNVEKLIKELPQNHFTDTDLQIAWQKFIQELQQKDILIYNCLLYTSRCV